MLSETLTAGLEKYKIGPKIRALRLKKKLGLVQLGEHTGLSPAMLSKIERGQLFPTLPTLLRIALVFGVGLEHFFVEEERPTVAVVRSNDRLRLPDLSGDEAPAYFFESLDFPATDRRMESFYAEFPLRSKRSKPHRHGSAEFIYVIEGQLVVDVDGRDFVLDEGDAMYFDSTALHSYRRESRSLCTALVVVAP
jgi:transcriptional regulator with XRE-family HTH domain